ncbi:MAG: hypothetical protein RIS44_3046 [Pseudomonadota bacterium]|jgi:general secretion pathway protein D
MQLKLPTVCFFSALSLVAYAQPSVPAMVASAGSVELALPTGKDDAPETSARIIRGNDRVVGAPQSSLEIQGQPSAFKFEDAALIDVINLLLGEIMKVDYVVHQPITGSVTMAARQAISPDQAVSLLEAALQAHGVLMVRDTRGTYHVGKPESLKGIVAAVRQVSKGSLPPGYGAIIVPLQFVGAGEMATILRPMMSAENLVRVDGVRNLLVLVGTRSQAEGWLDMVNTFDVDWLKGMSVGVFPLKYATVKEVEAALRLMSQGSAPTVPSASAGAAAGGVVALAESNPLFGALRIMPIERLNSILVVTPRAAYLEEARRWIDRLDKPSETGAESQLFVYPVQNGSAQHLADVLNGIFGTGTGASGAAGTSGGSGVAPRLSATTSSSIAGTGFSTTPGQTTPPPVGAQAAANRSSSPVTSVTLGQGVRVVADDRNNAVLIYGTRADYGRIETALKKLDLPPTQVLIEASIIEVTLTDELNYGVQWMFSDKSRDGLTGTGVISGIKDGALGGVSSGFSYTLRNPLGSVRAVLNALANKTKLNVIASPSLMVLDNHTASISSGTQQPINAGTTVVAGGISTTNIQYRDTGVVLAVTPSVNAGDMVTMEINQSVTDVGPPDTGNSTGNTGQVTFLQRQIASKVAVRSGETLVLGGLIREKNTSGAGGVPGLQDIPLLGALFGVKSKNLNRTELLVVITPRVVRSDVSMREVGDELRDRMKGLQEVPGQPFFGRFEQGR